MPTIKLSLKVEFKLEELRDVVAERFPLVNLSDNALESLFVNNLQKRIYDRMPEDIGWRVKHDDYFRDFYVRLHDLQEEAEDQLAKEEANEWERGYWKDVGAA
jgi:hypothetical protein